MRLFFKLLLIFASSCVASPAWSASCCGGGTSFPSLISGDFEWQFSSSLSSSQVLADSNISGTTIARTDDFRLSSNTLSLMGSYLLSDLWQVGIVLPVTENSYKASTHKHYSLGDTEVFLGYEALPETTFSLWKPRAIVYLRMILPTGLSIYDSVNPLEQPATGRGFFTPSMGVFIFKTWSHWDLQALAAIETPLEQRFNEILYRPQWNYRGLIGAGYSFAKGLRIGASVAPSYVGGVEVPSHHATSSSYFDTSIVTSFMPNPSWLFSASYTDQTLLPSWNQPLSQTFSLFIQRRTML
ncbi:MAG: hypothetical protein H6626_07590 [Pseudobdellovibrionaceae bacterium]|nr:hypothetical protein [Bdellovibrionales bacterium]USN46090.1 MAG: hypothetical protein H6626_07590 [Pseudobdellovibrionaceae bacterium]